MKLDRIKYVIPAAAIMFNLNYVYALTPEQETEQIFSQIKALHVDQTKPVEKDFVIKFYERIYEAADGEESRWSMIPLKLVSYPITKMEYEIFQPVVSTFTESVNRNPLHNALGSIDELTQSVRLLKNGILDLGRGVLHPTKAGVIDGSLEIADAGINLVTGFGLGLVKTVVSIPAYPLARLLGVRQSERSAIKGKRGAIVLIDSGSGLYPIDAALDTYGDMIVRDQLNGVVDYYCVESSVQGRASDCLEKMPQDIEHLDLIALTHTGGSSDIERLANKAAAQDKKIGLMLSIGCYDNPSHETHPNDTMGQQGLSWAVHYYLSSAIAKRLRGIPMQEASRQAFSESLPVNFANPISLIGMLATKGLKGSRPDVIDFDPLKDMEYKKWTTSKIAKRYKIVINTAKN